MLLSCRSSSRRESRLLSSSCHLRVRPAAWRPDTKASFHPGWSNRGRLFTRGQKRTEGSVFYGCRNMRMRSAHHFFDLHLSFTEGGACVQTGQRWHEASMTHQFNNRNTWSTLVFLCSFCTSSTFVIYIIHLCFLCSLFVVNHPSSYEKSSLLKCECETLAPFCLHLYMLKPVLPNLTSSRRRLPGVAITVPAPPYPSGCIVLWCV